MAQSAEGFRHGNPIEHTFLEDSCQVGQPHSGLCDGLAPATGEVEAHCVAPEWFTMESPSIISITVHAQNLVVLQS